MHIVIDCRFVQHSGIGRYLREIVPRLVQEPLEASGTSPFGQGGNALCRYTLLASPHETDENFMRACRQPQVAFCQMSAPMYSIREQWELPRTVPPCDLFWAMHYNAPMLPLRARKRMVTIHDMAHLSFQEGMSLPQKLYARLLMYTSTHFYDRILTDSRFSKEEILRHERIPADRVRVVHCGVDFARYHGQQEEGRLRAAREKYGLPEHYFLYVGNVKPNKNLRRLIQAYGAFRKSKEEGPGLVIVGKREGFVNGIEGLDRLMEDACPPDTVRFTGYVEEDDLPCLYQGAEAFLFPSLYEGFGLPPLEAMASGCPVLVSNAASLPEVCGDGAVYADPYDIDSMRRAMNQILDGDRAALISRGRAQARKFSWDRAAAQVREILSELAGTLQM